MTNEDLMLKIILLGNGNVGKTSLATRFAKNTFKVQYQPSIGVNMLVKMVLFKDQYIKVLVFDTAGQEFMSALRKQHYAGAHGAVLVFDLTSRKSFEDLGKWFNEVQEEIGSISTVVVGNKTDLVTGREISYEEAFNYASTINGTYLESSAKLDVRVTDIFQHFIEKAVQN